MIRGVFITLAVAVLAGCSSGSTVMTPEKLDAHMRAQAEQTAVRKNAEDSQKAATQRLVQNYRNCVKLAASAAYVSGYGSAMAVEQGFIACQTEERVIITPMGEFTGGWLAAKYRLKQEIIAQLEGR